MDEIFLPVPIVTGLADEPSILRRVKETNNILVLKLLLAVYRDVALDRTYGLPLPTLSAKQTDDYSSAKVIQTGIFNLWHLPKPHTQHVDRSWVSSIFGVGEASPTMFNDFWEAFNILRNAGALTVEDWVFDSDNPDAEPLFPIDLEGIYENDLNDPARLTNILLSTAFNFVGDKEYILDQFDGGLLLPIPSHCSPPAIRGVVKVRIEPDSPGRRMSYAKRMKALEHFTTTFQRASEEYRNQNFNRPFSLLPTENIN